MNEAAEKMIVTTADIRAREVQRYSPLSEEQ